MQYALLIYEIAETFAARTEHDGDSEYAEYFGAWRAYHNRWKCARLRST